MAPDDAARLARALADRYRIERELGSGGMATVYLAHDIRHDRQVAIKVLHPHLAELVGAERFLKEIKTTAHLQHPHILPLFDSGDAGGLLFYVMPYVDGESLRERIAREKRLPVADAVQITSDVASALDYAHRHGVIHRDIKPENILLHDGRALVADFGIAFAPTGADSRLTEAGMSIGTPGYMSPEQALGERQLDARCDIYAVGVMLYEMLTGAPPFTGASAQAIVAKVITENPVPPSRLRKEIPAYLDNAVLTALQKNPADRFPRAAALQEAIEGRSGLHSQDNPAWNAPGRKRNLVVVAGAAVVLLATLGAFLYKRGPAAPTAGGGNELTSVAVLPLINVGGDTASEYFSDGMTDELANALGKLPGLHVVSRTSAYTFKGRRNADAAEVGRKLHVQAFIGGTVRRAGDRLRVTAHLTNVSNGLELWSETYERPVMDVFQVQDDISRSITEALRLKLGARAAGRSSIESAASRGTENLEAYDAYLRGIYLWNRRDADNLTRAIAQFERAVAIDPRFGRAYAAMASVYALLPEYTDSPPPDAPKRARDAASRALAIDSTLAEAYTALGLVAIHEWNYPAAEKQYRMAILLDPQYPTGHQWYAEFLFHTGRVDSGIAEIRRAIALDPLAPILEGVYSWGLYLAGRYDEAIAAGKRGIELAPTAGVIHASLARSYLENREYTQGVREMELSARLDPNLALRQGQLAYAYGVSGDKERARALLAKLTERAKSEKISPLAFALAYVGLGETDAALSALERAVDQHDIALTAWSLTDHDWDSIRGEPRFTRILERTNLAPYLGGANRR